MGLRPYNSTNEYSFFRGVAATINLFKNVDITPFISFRNLDASQKLDAEGNLVQSTINQTGLHRTPTEIKNKGVLAQRVFGTTLQYTKTNLLLVQLLIIPIIRVVLLRKLRLTIGIVSQENR